MKCNNAVDLAAAAITTVILGARSYREGKVYHFDSDTLTIHEGDSSWASDGKPNLAIAKSRTIFPAGRQAIPEVFSRIPNTCRLPVRGKTVKDPAGDNPVVPNSKDKKKKK